MKEGITIYDSLYIAFAEKEGFNFGHIHMLGGGKHAWAQAVNP
jgi:hypothetical protein